MKIKLIAASVSLFVLAACGGGAEPNKGGGDVTLTHSLTAPLVAPNNFTTNITVASDSQKQVALFWSANSQFDAADNGFKIYSSMCTGNCLGAAQALNCNVAKSPNTLSCGASATLPSLGDGYLIAISCNFTNPIQHNDFFTANAGKCTGVSRAISFR